MLLPVFLPDSTAVTFENAIISLATFNIKHALANGKKLFLFLKIIVVR